jgi:hypothetical protein
MVQTRINKKIQHELKRIKVISPATVQKELKYVFEYAAEHFTGITFPPASGVGGMRILSKTSASFIAACTAVINLYGGSKMTDQMQTNGIFAADVAKLEEVCGPTPIGRRDVAFVKTASFLGDRLGSL